MPSGRIDCQIVRSSFPPNGDRPVAFVVAPDVLDTDTPTDGLAGEIRGRLTAAAAPLKLADVLKGLPKPKGVSAAAFKASALQALDDEFRLGRAYRYPSGTKGAERFWSRDEKQVLRDAAVAAAATPKKFSALKTATATAIKGTDGGFVEAVLRDLVGDDRLFEHPSTGKAGGAMFAAVPPPPPATGLDLPKFKKRLDTLVKSAEKLLADAGVSAEALAAAVLARLAPTDAAADPVVAPRSTAVVPELEQIILKAVAEAGPGSVLSAADLRSEMPAEYRGPEFDATVLALAEAGRVRVYQDADPLSFSPKNGPNTLQTPTGTYSPRSLAGGTHDAFRTEQSVHE